MQIFYDPAQHLPIKYLGELLGSAEPKIIIFIIWMSYNIMNIIIL